MNDPTTLPTDWPPGARVLGWYANGAADTPWGERCVWLVHPLPGRGRGAPAEREHVTVRPARAVPPGLAVPDCLEPLWLWDAAAGGYRAWSPAAVVAQGTQYGQPETAPGAAA